MTFSVLEKSLPSNYPLLTVCANKRLYSLLEKKRYYLVKKMQYFLQRIV